MAIPPSFILENKRQEKDDGRPSLGKREKW
jgi:hypothetical protein